MKKIMLPLVLLLSPLMISANTALPPCQKCELLGLEQLLAFMPIVTFLLIVIIIFWKLNKEAYKIGDALKENTTIEVSEDNPALNEPPKPASTGEVKDKASAAATTATAKNTTPYVPKTIQPKSTSRLIAFISGLVSVGLGSCLCSFWMYNYLVNNEYLDMSSVTNVLLALGLGVVPYAVNKIAGSK